MSTSPYHQLIKEYARLLGESRRLPLGGFPSAPRPDLPSSASTLMVFSPHPDDECIIGALPLRLLRESGKRVLNVGVTLGSNQLRQQARYEELRAACHYIGFDLCLPAPLGLSSINYFSRQNDPVQWRESVGAIHQLLDKHQPQGIFFPHDDDWNSTHIGTHYLVMDALREMPDNFQTYLIETEYWGAMDTPNLMVESSEDDVADLVAATSFHVGEVKRNPFHLLLPAWMQDNVRRGSELVGGQGKEAPNFKFATLYRVRRWANGLIQNVFNQGKMLAQSENAEGIFF